MLTEQNLNPDDQEKAAQIAEEIYQLQHGLALRYEMLTLASEVPLPVEEYESLLAEYQIPYLPNVVMEQLVSQWRKAISLGHTGRLIMDRSKRKHRLNQ